jgi:protein involved in polysaccharide export with SLBB domain
MKTTLLTLTILAFGAAVPAAAQAPRADTGPWQASRTTLESLAQAATADGQAEAIRTRLRTGDFRPGDRIALVVLGEPALTDTFTVEAGPVLQLPDVGPVSLAGVLRSEIESHLTSELGQYVREPRVKADALMHLGVIGGVGRPGFYEVAPSLPLDQVLMVAGGLLPDARIRDLKVERDGEEVEDEGEQYQAALHDGRSVASLGLRSGDRVVVPLSRGSRTLTALQIVALAVSIPLGVYGLATTF